MGSIVRMDPKPPSKCWYMFRPSPQPIGQNGVFKIENGSRKSLIFCESNCVIDCLLSQGSIYGFILF